MDELDTLPELDYLTRDYAGFRQLMLDQLSVLVPDWTEQHPADIGKVVLEVLAYAADYLSYYQDAMASEAYLGTARLRRSIRQHVRLLDYDWHEGCNARVWVQVRVSGGSPVVLKASTPILTRLETGRTDPCLSRDDYKSALAQQPVVFETMHDAALLEAHNEIHFYAEDPGKPLPKGATTAQLRDSDDERCRLDLRPGDVLVFEEKLDPRTGLKHRADPAHRQAVRLTQVTRGRNRGQPILQIEWSVEDALSFPLALSTSRGRGQQTCVALGNIVLADHGQTILQDELLPPIPEAGRYYPQLRQKGLTFRVVYDHERAKTTSASGTVTQSPRQALPAVTLLELGREQLKRAQAAGQPMLLDTYDDPDPGNKAYKDHAIKRWTLTSELLSSGTFTRDYAVEVEEDGRAYLRFGYGLVGWQPAVAGALCLARYRIGNGTVGNIGPDALVHVVTDDDRLTGTVTGVRNPLAARGGSDPSDRDGARLHAPYAFQKPERCVTAEDYAAIAGRHPKVAQAAAQFQWSGSWNAAVIYVQRRDDQPVDTAFQRELRDWLEPFRLAGHEFEIREARYVPLDIELSISVKPGYRTESVQAKVAEALSNGAQSDGTDGFFDPARFAFGQALYRSQVIGRAMQVPGVARVDVVRFRRMDRAVDVECIPVGFLEIIRLDNDPGHPATGQLVLSYA